MKVLRETAKAQENFTLSVFDIFMTHVRIEIRLFVRRWLMQISL